MIIPSRGCVAAVMLQLGCSAQVPAPAGDLPSWTLLDAVADPAPTLLSIPPAPPSRRRPLPAFHHRCLDRRFPALAGPWVLGCGPGGHLDRAEHLVTGQVVELESAADSAGLTPGALFATGAEHGLWELPSPSPRQAWAPTGARVVSPPALDGRYMAVALEEAIAVQAVGEARQLRRTAAPLPWFPPALDWPVVYWVDGRDQAVSGLDIWGWDTRRGPPFPVVTRPGDQRHVAVSPALLCWLDDEGVWLQDRVSGERHLHRAEVGFQAGPTLWGSVACWEERDAGDVDVRCSDGLEATGEGDQGWPSRWQAWLLFRQEDMPWLVEITPAQESAP